MDEMSCTSASSHAVQKKSPATVEDGQVQAAAATESASIRGLCDGEALTTSSCSSSVSVLILELRQDPWLADSRIRILNLSWRHQALIGLLPEAHVGPAPAGPKAV